MLFILGIGFTVLPEKTDRAVLSLNVTLLEKPGAEPAPGMSAAPSEPQPVIEQPAPAEPPPPPVQPQATPAPEPVVSAEPPKPVTPKQDVAKPQRAPAASAPAARPAPPAPPPRAPAARPAPPPVPAPKLSGADLRNLGLQMARQTPSPDPETLSSREKRLNSPSMTTLEKFYEESWVRKVEQVGNLNFPEEARRRNLTRGPVLAVAIRADGTIKNIRILSSSGHPPLDQAATQIVRLASPYSPFPPELRRQYDVLTIVRRWEFKHGRLSGR
jgi:protein TonB